MCVFSQIRGFGLQKEQRRSADVRQIVQPRTHAGNKRASLVSVARLSLRAAALGKSVPADTCALRGNQIRFFLSSHQAACMAGARAQLCTVSAIRYKVDSCPTWQHSIYTRSPRGRLKLRQRRWSHWNGISCGLSR